MCFVKRENEELKYELIKRNTDKLNVYDQWQEVRITLIVSTIVHFKASKSALMISVFCDEWPVIKKGVRMILVKFK